MSYADIVAGLHARFRTVEGIGPILAYEPTAIHDTPTLYSLLDSYVRTPERGQTRMRYRILCRCVFRWQDTEEAEVELMGYVNSLPASIDGDSRLGGVATLPAAAADAQAVFVVIGGTLYRAIDMYVEVEEVAAFRSGI
jgi:hypothetical protein